MTIAEARYDDHADWYLEYTRSWRSVSAEFLPDDLTGQRILDLACGYGQLSRTLAERGAEVTGVDMSTRLIANAREIEAREAAGIRYLCGDATRTDWWDGEAFDGVVCNMALMDIDDLDGALSTVTTVLKPSGWFSLAVFHPCFPGDPDDTASLPSWDPSAGYAAEGWWTTGQEGVRGHVGANHRMLSTYLNAVVRAGLVFEEFAEPQAALPRVFAARCRLAA